MFGWLRNLPVPLRRINLLLGAQMDKPILFWFGAAVLLVAVIVLGGTRAFSFEDGGQSFPYLAFFLYGPFHILTRLLMLAGAVLLAQYFELLPFSGWRSDSKERRLARLGACFILATLVIEMGLALQSLWISFQSYLRYLEAVP